VHIRKRAGAITILALATILAACSSSTKTATTASTTAAAGSGAGTTAPKSVGTVGVDYPRADTDFWNSYIKYVPQMAKQLGLTIQTTNSQNDVTKLIANIQALLSQGAKGFVMAPQDTAAVGPLLNQLSGQKIPVVTIDTRPDTGNVFMVVRADNKAYGQKACDFLGQKLNGKGKVVMFEGALSSINGRDRTDAFNQCMQQKFPNIKVFGEPTEWKGDVAAAKLQTVLAANPDINGIYMQAGGAFLAPALQVLTQNHLLVPPSDPKHIFIVSNDGIPEEIKAIKAGNIDATVSQPADLYAKYGLFYIQAALQGKTFQPGPTDHGSTIIQVRDGVLEDQLPAPLVTSANASDPSLWGNQI
jgi:ribose transport system substrate-binding protein